MDCSFDPNGEIALVTGASGGLGFEIARGLARAGALVVLHGRDPVRLRAAIALMVEREPSASISWSTTPAFATGAPSPRWTGPPFVN